MLEHAQQNGQAARVSLDDAARWIDAHAAPLGPETVAIEIAGGRVLAAPIAAPVDVPPFDRAAIEGVALRAEETFGAGAYNPLSFPLAASGDDLPPAQAMRVLPGDRLPAGADAVASLDHVAFDEPGACTIIEPLAQGADIERAGAHAARGTILFSAGRRLHAGNLALLMETAIADISVIRRPRVRVSCEAAPTTLMLHDLVTRDGGKVVSEDADLELVVGAWTGTLAIDGVALQPGLETGMGLTDRGIPVFRLPLLPIACFFAYELLAGRAVRRFGSRDVAPPYPKRLMRTTKKLVSSIGLTEPCPVRRIDDEHIEPIVSFTAGGLVSAAQADGFVLIPDASEGYAAGSTVTVHITNMTAR